MQQQPRTLYNTQSVAGTNQGQNINLAGSQDASAQVASVTSSNHELATMPLVEVKNKENGHLSPLEIIDQTDDDEKLLQALEGLTLDSGLEEPTHSQLLMQSGTGTPMLTTGSQNMPNPTTLNEERKGEDEPTGEHGTRSQFIKDVSERLISRVNTEAANIEEAKQLMSQYMMEFCAEYDRCGYGVAGKSGKSGSGQQSDNQQNLGSRTGATVSASQGTSGSSGKQSQQQMAFDNQILKKGVRVLSKNLQRANQQNTVKDQQLKVMRNILLHQKSQLTSLQASQNI